MDNSINNVAFGAKLKTKMLGRNGVIKPLVEEFEKRTANMPGTLKLVRGNTYDSSHSIKYFQLEGSENKMFLDCDEFMATKTGKHSSTQRKKLVSKLIRIFKILTVENKADKQISAINNEIARKGNVIRQDCRAFERTSGPLRKSFDAAIEMTKSSITKLQTEKNAIKTQTHNKMRRIAKNDKDVLEAYIE